MNHLNRQRDEDMRQGLLQMVHAIEQCWNIAPRTSTIRRRYKSLMRALADAGVAVVWDGDKATIDAATRKERDETL